MLCEGSGEILRYGETFDVMFARNDWNGVMSPRKPPGREALVTFLRNSLRFTSNSVEGAKSQLDSQGPAHLPCVLLIDEEQLDLGLVVRTNSFTLDSFGDSPGTMVHYFGA
jgi:hypothetical protein